MQKALFPMKYLTVTQKYGVDTHKGSFALDLAGKDSGISPAYAPFDCTVKKIWENGHSVWFQSDAKVQFADGRVDYATVMMTHDDFVSDLRVGQRFKQGNKIYDEGTAGYATGNHIHMEAGLGKFTGTGWFLNTYNIWTINNPYPLHRLFWLKKDTIIKASGGYAWKRTTAPVPVYAIVTGKLGANVRASATTKSKVVKYIPYKYVFTYNKIVTGQRHRIGTRVTDKWIKTGKGNYVSTLVAKKKG